MDKQYVKPEIASYGVQLAQLLCQSEVDETEVNFGEGYPDDLEDDSQDNYW